MIIDICLVINKRANIMRDFMMYLDCYLYQQNTNKNNGVFTNDSSANLMVGCSGPLTPPPTTDESLSDTTIMPHPHAQQVINTLMLH